MTDREAALRQKIEAEHEKLKVLTAKLKEQERLKKKQLERKYNKAQIDFTNTLKELGNEQLINDILQQLEGKYRLKKTEQLIKEFFKQ